MDFKKAVFWVKTEWHWRIGRKLTMQAFWFWLAFRLPRPLVSFAAIRLGAHATSGPWSRCSPTDLLYMDALRRWDLTGDKALLDAKLHAQGVSLTGFPTENPPATTPGPRIIIPGTFYPN